MLLSKQGSCSVQACTGFVWLLLYSMLVPLASRGWGFWQGVGLLTKSGSVLLLWTFCVSCLTPTPAALSGKHWQSSTFVGMQWVDLSGWSMQLMLLL